MAPFVLAVSFGESHTLICPPVPSFSLQLSCDVSNNVPKYQGYPPLFLLLFSFFLFSSLLFHYASIIFIFIIILIVSRYWVRLATGLQTAEEIKKGLIHLFARQPSFQEVLGEVIEVDGTSLLPTNNNSKKSKQKEAIIINSTTTPATSLPSPSSSTDPSPSPSFSSDSLPSSSIKTSEEEKSEIKLVENENQPGKEAQLEDNKEEDKEQEEEKESNNEEQESSSSPSSPEVKRIERQPLDASTHADLAVIDPPVPSSSSSSSLPLSPIASSSNKYSTSTKLEHELVIRTNIDIKLLLNGIFL